MHFHFKFPVLAVLIGNRGLAQLVTVADPRSHQLGKFYFLILIAKMATILEDGQRAVGQQRMQLFRIFCLQKRILFAPKNVDRHIQCREMRIDVFAAFWVPFEPLSDRANPTRIRSDIISDLLGGRTII